MKKTFTFNTEISEKILNSYKKFLTFNFGSSDEFTDKVLELVDKLNTENFSLILEKSFQASLEKEEGRHHNFSLILSPPKYLFDELLENNWRGGYFRDVASFEDPISIDYLPKIAPAFESTNRKLRVWLSNDNKVEIWGFASKYFDYFGIEIKSFSSGQLLVHIKPKDFPHARYLITLSESKLVVRHDNLIELLFNENFITQKLSLPNAQNLSDDNIHKIQKRYYFLLDVINKVMEHKHGGTILFINQEYSSEIIEESIRSISYKPTDKYDYIERRLAEEDNQLVNLSRTSNEAMFIAQTTAVDGATIINKDFGILAFGAKIKPKNESITGVKRDNLKNIWVKEPFENFTEHSIKLSKLGGMRHQSTAQFVFDQRERDVFAIVASEDGKVSIMYWDKTKKMVIVMRHVEYLFYGMNI